MLHQRLIAQPTGSMKDSKSTTSKNVKSETKNDEAEQLMIVVKNYLIEAFGHSTFFS